MAANPHSLTRRPGARRAIRLLHHLLAAAMLLAGAGLTRPAPTEAGPPRERPTRYSLPAMPALTRQRLEPAEPVVTNTLQLPVWLSTPGPQQIVFHSDRDGNYEIYRMNQDGTSPVRLTNHPAIDQSPAWSLGQVLVAFQSNRDGNSEIYRMDANGNNVVRLTNILSDDKSPSWSIGTGRIAFSSNRDGNYEIYTMDANGNNVLRLTNNTTPDLRPRWAPNDQKIAYGASGTITVMNTDGSGQVGLTLGTDPDWSTDGQRLAFTCTRDLSFEICLINANGTGEVRLTTNASLDFLPVWAPVGQQLAFVSDADHNLYEIYSMDPTVGAPFTRLITNNFSDDVPDW